MIIVGDHKDHFKEYKYLEYPKENSKLVNSTKKKLHIQKLKRMDYSIWLKSLNRERINYLKEVGIKDKKQLRILSKMFFHHLPYEIRYKLQTIPV